MTDTDAIEWASREEPGWSRVEPLGNMVGGNFVTGDGTGRWVRIHYYRREPDGSLMAKAVFTPDAQGPPGHAHGGSIASVLDETMGRAAWMAGHTVVAAKLVTRFRRMVPLGAPCVITTRVVGVGRRKVRMGSELRAQSGEVLAEGEGVFVVLKPARFGDLARNATKEKKKAQ